ncbi:hypothetical protein BC628DRAFT_1350649 [Trametes gibbosa]|nr:hypothetical protein BC628DRAFT_1350649 [Trametes gibbosa]
MTPIIREVSSPSEAELNEYAKILAESFDYNLFGAGLGNDKSLQEPFILAHLNAALVSGEGQVHVAELPGVGVAGVAVWFGPGYKFLDSKAQRNAGWDEIMSRLEPQYQDWWETFLATYDELVEKSLGSGVKLGAYHLQLIGVAPKHQKKGVAGALTRYAEAKAHAVHVRSVLETVGAVNVSIYKALGYGVAGSGPIKSPPPYEGNFEMFVFSKRTDNESYVA